MHPILIISIIFSTFMTNSLAMPINFDGMFNCIISQHFNLYIKYFEDSNQLEPIAWSDGIIMNQNRVVIVGFEYNNEEKENVVYNFLGKIAHNCTSDGGIRKVVHYFPPLAFDRKTGELHYLENLADHGERINDYKDI